MDEVRLVSPASAWLYYVPFRIWSLPGGASTIPALGATDAASGRRSITFECCGRQPLGFTSGVTTVGPACVTRKVTAPGRPAASVRLSLGARCSA
jgi:hypothetical protein